MVTDLIGKATMTQGKVSDINILSEIEAATQVQLAPGTTMVILYIGSGDEYLLKGPATIIFKPTNLEVLSGSQPEKRSNAIVKGVGVRIKSVGLVQGATVMRSSVNKPLFKLLNLYDTKTIETQPFFRWEEMQPNTTYQLQITDNKSEIFYMTAVDTSSLKLPANVVLKEGVTYTWEVSVALPGGKKFSRMADFELAPKELRIQTEALRPDTSAPLSMQIAYAVWLDQMGLKDEARQYWKAAAKERPDDIKLKLIAEQ